MGSSIELLEQGGTSSDATARPSKPPSPVKTALYVFTLAVISAVIGVIFNMLFAPGAALAGSLVDKIAHTILGIVLGFFLVLRLAIAMGQFGTTKAALCSFYSAAATIAICSSQVSEALTISAGAEHEKKGIYTFRSELARLLGFGVRCINHAIKGEPVVKDAHLMTVENMLVIQGASRPSPTLFAVKLVAKLIAVQREAGRLDASLCAEVNAQLAVMVNAYNTVVSSKKMPMPASVSEFAFAWLVGFCFTVPIVISSYTYATPWVAPCASLFIAAFFFALNEIAVQLEDLSTVFAYDVGLAETERQVMFDLQMFSSESVSASEGML